MRDSAKDFVNEWKRKVDLGIQYKTKYTDLNNYEKYRSWYRGDFGEAKISRPVNRIFSYLKGMVPRAYFRSPTIIVSPLRPELKWHARVMEAIDNYLIRVTNIKMVMKAAALSAGITGFGPIKLGFDSEFGFLPSQAVDQNMATITQVSTKTGDRIEYSDNVKPGLPWAMNVMSEDVITPYGYKDPDSLPWICHIVLRPLADVQADQKYRNTKDLKGGFTHSVSDVMKRKYYPISEWKDDPYCALYEIRDKKTKKVFVICEDQLLLDADDVLQADGGVPWEFVVFNEDPEFFGGIPDIKLIAPQQLEMNEIRSQASRQRKYSMIKFLYQKGIMDPTDLERLLSDDIEDIGAGIPVDSDNPQSSILPMQPHALTNDLRMEMQATEADMMRTIGMGDNQEGRMSPYSSKTASEAMITQQGAEVRMNERRDHMADVLTGIVTKFNHYIWKCWTEERVVEIVGPDYAKYWIKYSGDMLKGDYMIKVDADSGLPVTRGLRYEQSERLFTLLKGHPMIDQAELVRQLLQPYEWIDPSYDLLVQQPPPAVPGTGMPGMSIPLMQMAQGGPQGGGRPPGGPRGPQGKQPGASPTNALPFNQLPSAGGGVQ